MSTTFFLSHAEARKRARQAVSDAPEGYAVVIREPTRSLNQNAAMWPLLDDVSKQVNWYGNKLTKEEWKDVFTAALKKQKAVPGIDGGFVVCGNSKKVLSKREFSDLLEIITAFAATHNVKFSCSEREN